MGHEGRVMQRDPELLRKILLRIEQVCNGSGFVPLRLEDEDPHAVGYHVRLLEDNDLIVGPASGCVKDGRGDAPPAIAISGLTAKGLDALDSLRDPTVWKKAKEAITKSGSWTLSTLIELGKQLALDQAKKMAGLQ
jgi:Hypothetical protein (DUF2513)